jgi:hypothetical protein
VILTSATLVRKPAAWMVAPLPGNDPGVSTRAGDRGELVGGLVLIGAGIAVAAGLI